MKYLYTIIIITLFACEKKNDFRQSLSGTYLVTYHYSHSYPAKFLQIPYTNIPAIITNKFDTIIEIVIKPSEINDSKLDINGLNKIEPNKNFGNEILNPILTIEGDLKISQDLFQSSFNGFIKKDSINYFYSTDNQFPHNFSIEGIKLK